MEFADRLREFSKKVESLRDKVSNEEATKTALIMPFFQLLGYDVFNPTEFVPEYSAELGLKKSEKVDYAIMRNGNPLILIEAKPVREKLDRHSSQLFKYFAATSSKFAILTNGVIYKVYTDLDEVNKMDNVPFMEFNVLKLKDVQIQHLKNFHRDNFDIDSISNVAIETKTENDIKKIFYSQIQNPSDAFVKFILSEGIYPGVKTQNIIERYRETVKKSFNQFINDIANERLETALNPQEVVETVTEYKEKEEKELELSNTELEIYKTISDILATNISKERIGYKKVDRYFSVILDGNIRKWVCRIFIKSNLCELSLRKISGLNLETEYEFTDPRQLLQIDDILSRVALKILEA